MIKNKKYILGLVVKNSILLIIFLISIAWFFNRQVKEEKELNNLKEEYAYLLITLTDWVEEDYAEGLLTEEVREEKINTYIEKIDRMNRLNKKELKEEYLSTIISIAEDFLEENQKGNISEQEVLFQLEPFDSIVIRLGKPNALYYIKTHLIE